MRLRPRHYILLLLVLSLGAFNFVRSRGHAPATAGTVSPRAEPTGPRPESPAWTAFEHAAGLRDASKEQFTPALDALHAQTGQPSQASQNSQTSQPSQNSQPRQAGQNSQASQTAASDPDLSGCSTWLEFYRQGVLHPSRDPSWRNRSTEHLDGCVKYHRDVSF